MRIYVTDDDNDNNNDGVDVDVDGDVDNNSQVNSYSPRTVHVSHLELEPTQSIKEIVWLFVTFS